MRTFPPGPDLLRHGRGGLEGVLQPSAGHLAVHRASSPERSRFQRDAGEFTRIFEDFGVIFDQEQFHFITSTVDIDSCVLGGFEAMQLFAVSGWMCSVPAQVFLSKVYNSLFYHPTVLFRLKFCLDGPLLN